MFCFFQSSSNLCNDIKEDGQIREKHFGKYEDIPISDFVEMAKLANMNPYDFTPETGETDESLENRTRAFLKDAIEKVHKF